MKNSRSALVIGIAIAVILVLGGGAALILGGSADKPMPSPGGPEVIKGGVPSPTQPASQPTGPAIDLSPWRGTAVWRYRYQSTPANAAREDLAQDYIVERRLAGAVDDGMGTLRVTIEEKGGPSEKESRTFTEFVGRHTIGSANLQASEDMHEEALELPGLGKQKVWKLSSTGIEVWVHDKLGKVKEVDVSADGTRVAVELVGYRVGSETGGDIETPIRRCQWTDNAGGSRGWLKNPNDSVRLSFSGPRGAGSAFGMRGSERSVLVISGSTGAPTNIGWPGALLAAKAWSDPVGQVEWVVGVWRNAAVGKSAITLTRLGPGGAESFTQELGVQYVNNETHDHYLLLLQRGSECVAGFGAGMGKDARVMAMYSLPASGRPARMGGSWK